MLWHKLQGAGGVGGAAGIEFVGSYGVSNAQSASISVSLTSLSGGIATQPSAGDIVIAAVSFVESPDKDITCTTSGYTEVTELYVNGTRDTNMAVFYKVLSSAETVVAFGGTGDTQSNISTIIYVWRGIDQSTPLDATSTTATKTNSGIPDCPSITTVTNNAVVVGFGAAGGGGTQPDIFNLTTPSGVSNFIEAYDSSGDRENTLAAFSYLQETAGSYDPPIFGITNGSDDTDYTSGSVTMALRPA